MRIIEYKEPSSNQFNRYIDIGSCKKHYDYLPLFDEAKIDYKQWYLKYLKLPIGVQILTLHYYLLEYNSGNYLPNAINNIISRNIIYLNDFNQKWFEPDVPFFRELDLNWEDIEDQITAFKEKNNGIRTEVQFDNGAVIKFLDDNDAIKSFYVLEIHFPELQVELLNILEKFQ
jgi:hypothetical protein